MHKKYYFAIAIAHLFLSISLLTPILVISETKVGWGGYTSQNMYRLNLFEYIAHDTYTINSACMIVFSILSVVGGIYALIQVFLKVPNRQASQISFVLGFSSAILGALQIDSKSYLFFAFCVISFFVISVSSIRLMKMED